MRRLVGGDGNDDEGGDDGCEGTDEDEEDEEIAIPAHGVGSGAEKLLALLFLSERDRANLVSQTMNVHDMIAPR